uniref:Uncharacterized protein, isoform A n=1 Tax=Drosophila melanogaster TaxID=7227 RepID=A0A0B4K7A1_DROME|nr:uncharacterized protein Dmel_CG43139, isoform A [Drosophila melanogaster]NP_001247338.1 uncharacterized protein Dmel_CG43139, isoform B [Drosophila melanogaster]AFH06654.1 uncharacterized protein Dmel_CG43139, isoform A [Drosophila melanogaster]AFH06655.1 uncharacterized protein Dmel_CG43139, isoform B [Drosophila melanogaster]|eukprot:NP_001247337.1 uncharacterized protein Dmel_CG43139, isoform A [Drosophila melanogaster]
MSRHSNWFCILFLAIQYPDFVLPAPAGNVPLDASDGLVTFRMTIDREFDQLQPELQLRWLQAQRQEDDFEVMRMQLLQMNLLKLLVALDCFILLCIWYYAREEKYYPVQNV